MENSDDSFNKQRFNELLERHEKYKIKLDEAEDKIRILKDKFKNLGEEKIKSFQTGHSLGLYGMKQAMLQMEAEKNKFLDRMEEMTNMVLELESKLENSGLDCESCRYFLERKPMTDEKVSDAAFKAVFFDVNFDDRV